MKNTAVADYRNSLDLKWNRKTKQGIRLKPLTGWAQGVETETEENCWRCSSRALGFQPSSGNGGTRKTGGQKQSYLYKVHISFGKWWKLLPTMVLNLNQECLCNFSKDYTVWIIEITHKISSADIHGSLLITTKYKWLQEKKCRRLPRGVPRVLS